MPLVRKHFAYEVIATWVPAGALVREGLSRQIYVGDDLLIAEEHLDAVVEMARSAIGLGGNLIAAVHDRDGRIVERDRRLLSRLQQIPRGWGGPWNRVSGGYPPHVRSSPDGAAGCGSPLVPGDLAKRSDVLPTELLCVGCGSIVRATPDQLRRATVSAQAETGTRAA